MNDKNIPPSRRKPVTRVPSDSFFYGKAVPALLALLVIVTVVLIVATAAVVFDVIPHG